MKTLKTEELTAYSLSELIKIILQLQQDNLQLQQDNELLKAEIARIKKSQANRR